MLRPKDFVGLAVAPVLLAAILNTKTWRGVAGSAGLVAFVFSAINISPAAASMWDRWVSQVFPFYTTTDPTDLVALVMVPFALWVFAPAMRGAKANTSKAVTFFAVALGGAACLATSPEPSCENCEPEWEFTPTFFSTLSILNFSNELHVVRIRTLSNTISIDCETIGDDPTAYLKDVYFGPATRWLIQSGQEIPVAQDQFGESRECDAARIESDTLPDIMVFWSQSQGLKQFEMDADIPKELTPNLNTLVIEAEYGDEQLHGYRERSTCGTNLDWCDEASYAYLADIPAGARYAWRTVSDRRVSWPIPVLDNGQVAGDECPMPGTGQSIYWSEPDLFARTISSGSISDDGCAELRLADSRSWYVCAPRFALEALVPVDGESLSIQINVQSLASTGFSGGYDALRVDVLEDDTVVRSVILSRGFAIPASVGATFSATWDADCAPLLDVCGLPVVPANITLSGIEAPFGEVVELPSSRGQAMVVRAFNMPVTDQSCTELTTQVPELSVSDETIFVELAVVQN